jgi:mannose-6-phosphate isomerase-like protein (cupin superfamily)
MKAFSAYEFKTGKIADLDRKFPSYLSAWDQDTLHLKEGDTHYIYCHEGEAFFKYQERGYTLVAGMFACVPGDTGVSGGKGIVVSREGWDGVFHLGGKIERRGRLKYIDGCTDSLLVPPVMMGDPCLNLLYFPPDIDQTAHTHPSDRIGMIMSGRGLCHAWNDGVEEKIELRAGLIFCIHTDGVHKFSTPFGDEMRVLAYHPDSDFGPTHQTHPMINRTIVDGVSASLLPSIQTK